ncbi:MAG: esterase family protein [Anaerolineaceae bacterium]|nr:esterase family protein [Anaerolineaceae bacterium]
MDSLRKHQAQSLQKPEAATAAMAVLFCVLVVLLSGCQSSPESVASSATPAPILTATATVTATPQPTPTPSGCQETTGRLEAQELPPGLASYPIPFQVYLPPCYDRRSGSYPLLVLLHGQSDSSDLWLRMGIQSLADDLIANGELPPFVIVMPTEAYYLQDFLDSVFGQALTGELLPWVENHYAVSTDRACRAIGGISRGAAWAALLGIENWQGFGAIGAHSVPNAPYSEPRLKILLDAISPGDVPRIWLDTGTQDRYRKSAREFDELLTRRGVEHEWYLNEGAHNEEYWQAHLADYLRWYAFPWRECAGP